MEPVIYKIRNVVNQKFYVGSTTNKKQRWTTHRKKLRQGKHHCHHLQAAWNKYGEDCFKFEVVDRIADAAHLQDAEDSWLVAHVGQNYCYNHGMRSGAPWRGITGEGHPNYGKSLSEEQKALLRQATKEQWATANPRAGKTHSPETRAKISKKIQQALAEGRGGKFIPTEETRRKMSEALKGNTCALGVKRTDAEKAAIAERMRGNQIWLGKKHSEETKVKLSEAHKGMQHRLGHTNTAEHRAKISAALTGKKLSPEHVAKLHKCVVVTSPEGVVTIYQSGKEAAEALGIGRPHITRYAQKDGPVKRGKLKGYEFTYDH